MKWYYTKCNSRPKIGTFLLLALVTKEGGSIKDSRNISNSEECGMATVMGASLGGTGRPMILI